MRASNSSQMLMEEASPGSLACFLRPALQGGRVVSSSRMPTIGPVPLKPAIAAFRSLNKAAGLSMQTDISDPPMINSNAQHPEQQGQLPSMSSEVYCLVTPVWIQNSWLTGSAGKVSNDDLSTTNQLEWPSVASQSPDRSTVPQAHSPASGPYLSFRQKSPWQVYMDLHRTRPRQYTQQLGCSWHRGGRGGTKTLQGSIPAWPHTHAALHEIDLTQQHLGRARRRYATSDGPSAQSGIQTTCSRGH